MDNKTITRRLDALQQLADRRKPCQVKVIFSDGSEIITSPAGAIEACRSRKLGEIKSVVAERPDYIGLICTLSAVFGGGAGAQH